MDIVNNKYVDAANPEIWQALKREFNKPFEEKTVREKKAYPLKYNLHIEEQTFVVPVPFAIEGATINNHCLWAFCNTCCFKCK